MITVARASTVLLLATVLGTYALASDQKTTDMKTFKKPELEELKKKLTPEQFAITQQCGTEPPFQNAFWNNKKEGIYVDIVSGEPLFSSKDKFDSGTGWPSFTKPLEQSNILDKKDTSHGRVRTEVRSKHGESHLGHVFEDGPGPKGLRYCINSSALRFIPIEDLEREGYGSYVADFGKKPIEKTSSLAMATFAGGCFWGVEEILRKIPGVVEIVAGYTGGTVENPIYEQVKKGNTGHAESVQITYDPKKVSYETLLDYFWRLHDPTTLNRQGNDVGTQYRSAVFYHNEEQKNAALKMKEVVSRSGKWKNAIVTEIVPASTFYPAEDYHQDYLQKFPDGYNCHFLRD